MGAEIHCLSSCGKAMCGWIARDCIQECREACGGHGYLKASRLGHLRNDHCANNTYEGDNNVLLQQTSNHLVKLFREKRDEGRSMRSPFGSFDYIDDYPQILASVYPKEAFDTMSDAIQAYRFLICWLLRKSEEKLENKLASSDGNLFVARSQSQVYYLRTLAMAFFECDAISRFNRYVEEEAAGKSGLQEVLRHLGLLFALWSLEKHLATLFEAKYFAGHFPAATEMRESVLRLCDLLKGNAVALVDVFSPPDFILNSCLGFSDGKVYEHIFDALTHNEGAFDRPKWYRDFTENKPDISGLDNEQVIRAKL
jgi:acyl-CoA oxidase